MGELTANTAERDHIVSYTERNEVDVKNAVKIAKDYIRESFSTDDVKNIGLEEISFDEASNCWNITVGFSWPWEQAPINSLPGMAALNVMFPENLPRTYKIVTVSAVDGKVSKVTNRPA